MEATSFFVFCFLWSGALGEPPRISIREMGAVIETLEFYFIFVSLTLESFSITWADARAEQAGQG